VFRYKVKAVSGFLEIGTKLKLTEEQAKLRCHLLRKVGADLYILKGRASFLRSELVELERELPRQYEGIFELIPEKAQETPEPPAGTEDDPPEDSPTSTTKKIGRPRKSEKAQE